MRSSRQILGFSDGNRGSTDLGKLNKWHRDPEFLFASSTEADLKKRQQIGSGNNEHQLGHALIDSIHSAIISPAAATLQSIADTGASLVTVIEGCYFSNRLDIGVRPSALGSGNWSMRSTPWPHTSS
jgi:hypothetical protein